MVNCANCDVLRRVVYWQVPVRFQKGNVFCENLNTVRKSPSGSITHTTSTIMRRITRIMIKTAMQQLDHVSGKVSTPCKYQQLKVTYPHSF